MEIAQVENGLLADMDSEEVQMSYIDKGHLFVFVVNKPDEQGLISGQFKGWVLFFLLLSSFLSM